MPKISRMAVMALALAAACGSDDDASKFVGTWTYQNGAVTANCGGTPIPVDLTGEQVTISAGTSSDLVLQAGASCRINFSLDGNRASAAAGQTCTFAITGFGDVPVTLSSWTLDLSGSTITSAFSGTANATILGAPVTCDATGSGTLVKGGSPADSGTPADGGTGG